MEPKNHLCEKENHLPNLHYYVPVAQAVSNATGFGEAFDSADWGEIRWHQAF